MICDDNCFIVQIQGVVEISSILVVSICQKVTKIMLMFLHFFVAFPSRNDAILSSHVRDKKQPIVESSGSLGIYYSGKCHQTFPNETLVENKEFDWCSNLGSSDENNKPRITYSLKNEKIILTSISIRNGCCAHPCCCIDDNTFLDYECCCLLYSFTVKGSNDNQTWVTLIQENKIKDFWGCKFMNFEVGQSILHTERNNGGYRYIKLTLDEPYPGCRFCMQLNQVELYGETKGATFYDEDFNNQDEDESVSIIGKIKRPVLD